MMTVLAVVTVTTGYILWHHAQVGDIRFEETTEVSLMPAVFLVMAWHVRGRQRALAEREAVASLERQRAETQELFVRLGSHEQTRDGLRPVELGPAPDRVLTFSPLR